MSARMVGSTTTVASDQHDIVAGVGVRNCINIHTGVGVGGSAGVRGIVSTANASTVFDAGLDAGMGVNNGADVTVVVAECAGGRDANTVITAGAGAFLATKADECLGVRPTPSSKKVSPSRSPKLTPPLQRHRRQRTPVLAPTTVPPCSLMPASMSTPGRRRRNVRPQGQRCFNRSPATPDGPPPELPRS